MKTPEEYPKYFNRELSWLAFNRRVLEQAESDEYPLLERLRFMSYVSSNLDEFFEIRVAGLLQEVDSGITERSFDGLTPKEQLTRICKTTHQLVQEQYNCWTQQLVPAMNKEKIFFKKEDELSPKEIQWIQNYYEEQVYPVLTPLAVDNAHPFPHLTNKALYLLVWLEDPKSEIKKQIAIIPVPRILPRLVLIEGSEEEGQSYIFLSSILRVCASSLFPGYTVKGTWPFRITRNSDLYIDEEETESLLTKIEQQLHELRKGAAVRLEIRDNIDPDILNQLCTAIDLPQDYTFIVDGPINLMRLKSVYEHIDRPDLKFTPFAPHTPRALSKPELLFQNIANEDHLLHHPYDSFTPVVEFVRQAARDPQVFAIKQTLYRTSGDSPIVRALIEASQNGKQVTVLVELKARFDEANNIEWARQLEDVGVHVVYGLIHLKTHCKACLIVRREHGGLKRYVHLGTGNYNSTTAKTYTDFSLFTAREDITEEVAALFNTLTGFARTPVFNKLLIAPFTLHSKIQEHIQNETKNAKAGKPAHIFAKLNSLVDQTTIDNLYAASQAGVKVDLVVRGICGLVPGVKGQSENIRVTSILGRFLEHSRIFYFENGDKDSTLLVGSADWMPRNFIRRIESVFPIETPHHRDHIIQDLFSLYLKDTHSAKTLQPDGTYQPTKKKNDKETFSIQNYLIHHHTQR